MNKSESEKYKQDLIKNKTYTSEQRNDLALWQYIDYSWTPIQQLIKKSWDHYGLDQEITEK